jgi:hypothetical protein
MVQDSYSPKWEIDFAPINYRIQPGFISENLNLTGLLYWSIDLWSSDPWTDVNNVGMFHYWGSGENYPGEGMLVYPGQQVGITGVAPSMRLKWLRDGVEDYEYVEMLKKLGQGTWALQLASTIGANWTNWTRDPNALESVRKQLGTQLDLASGGGGAPPADQPPVDVSVSPNSGSGSGRTFTFTYSDPNGSGDLASVEALFNVSSTGANGCWVVFNPVTNIVSLADNSGSSWTYSALGSGLNLVNSQCTVKTGSSSASSSGNNLALKLNLTFTKSFRGAKNVYMRSKDKSGMVAGYDLKGTWTVN